MQDSSYTWILHVSEAFICKTLKRDHRKREIRTRTMGPYLVAGSADSNARFPGLALARRRRRAGPSRQRVFLFLATPPFLSRTAAPRRPVESLTYDSTTSYTATGMRIFADCIGEDYDPHTSSLVDDPLDGLPAVYRCHWTGR